MICNDRGGQFGGQSTPKFGGQLTLKMGDYHYQGAWIWGLTG